MQKIRVLLADDHTVVRQGLKVLLEAEPDILVVGDAENGRQALRLARKILPDIVVMDVAMPGLNGLEATRQIVKEIRGIRVLILSAYSDDEYVRQFVQAGAAGYLLKQTAVADLVQGVRQVKQGLPFFSPAVSRHLSHTSRDGYGCGEPVPKRPRHLTSRETEVLQLIAEGKANKQIAAELCISIKTVEKHRQQLMNKLNLHETAGLTRYAIEKGMVETSAGLKL